jgi:hypothetical protein
MLSLAQTIGIVGTMILTLYFSKKQIQSLAIDQQTRVLNDLDEKFLRMAELAMEDPSNKKSDRQSRNIITRVIILILYPMDLFPCLFYAPEEGA